MKHSEAEDILYQLVINFFNEKLSQGERAMMLIEKINMTDVLDLEDDFLNDTYFALKHFDEEVCKTTNAELLYLKECFEKKRKYSRDERDAFIQKNTK